MRVYNVAVQVHVVILRRKARISATIVGVVAVWPVIAVVDVTGRGVVVILVPRLDIPAHKHGQQADDGQTRPEVGLDDEHAGVHPAYRIELARDEVHYVDADADRKRRH